MLPAIRAERELLEPLKERADVVIDTTDLSASRLRKVVADKMLAREHRGKLAVTFLTYGFKHGAPHETDLVFDVRFLPNPHYESELRPKTGLDRGRDRLRRELGRDRRVLRPPDRRCSTTCCRSTSRRARRTSRSASAAPAGATARW